MDYLRLGLSGLMYSGGASEQLADRLLRRLFPNRDGYVLAT